MKKPLLTALALLLVLLLCGCTGSESVLISFSVPAGSEMGWVYAHEEICPRSGTIKLYADAGIARTNVLLVPCDENLEPLGPFSLAQREPVRVKVRKGEWYRVAIEEENPDDFSAAADMRVRNAEIRLP